MPGVAAETQTCEHQTFNSAVEGLTRGVVVKEATDTTTLTWGRGGVRRHRDFFSCQKRIFPFVHIG